MQRANVSDCIDASLSPLWRQEDAEEVVVLHRQEGRLTCHEQGISTVGLRKIGMDSYAKGGDREYGDSSLPLRANCWLDAMKASSPPPIWVSNGTSAATATSDSLYRAWMKKYPSALNAFDQIVASSKGKKIALFLDYDGTLSPIVDEPDNAFMSDAMRAVVKRVASRLPTAIISGRSRDKVFEFVKLTELYYAGSHGMDIMGPVRKSESAVHHTNSVRSTDKQGREVNLFQPANEFVPMIDEAFRLLVEKTKEIDGAKVENNKFCVAVHYRNVDEKDWQLVSRCAYDVLKSYPRLRLTHGRKVLEVRPVIDWNKGKAVEFLLDSLELGEAHSVLPIYLGDDRTDEDAFKFLREGKRGLGILVSSVPKESDALYSLMDPFEVMEFLKVLVRWEEEEASP